MLLERLRVVDIAGGHKGVRALIAFGRGDIISPFDGSRVEGASRYSVQTGASEHILLIPELLQYINHSCNPNVIFDTTHMVLRALRDIEADEEICYFYPATEWSMAEPFPCQCGDEICLGQIQGAKYLPAEVLDRYEFNTHIQAQLAKV
jgi:hypothetical protein